MKPVAIITGGGRGIGAATARLFAAEGHDICISYLSDHAAAEAVVRDCIARGARAIAVPGSVADRAAVAALFARCRAELGPVRCLVNNAGIIGAARRMQDLSAEDLERTFATNVFGAIYCLQEAIAQMSTARGGAGGSVVNMSSVAAVLGSAGEYVHYAASKAAIETLSIGAGKELAAEGIRVNAIRVGTANTGIHAQGGNPDRPARVAGLTPMGRIAEPEEIAEAALWLASHRSGFVTGTVLTVAGGLTA